MAYCSLERGGGEIQIFILNIVLLCNPWSQDHDFKNSRFNIAGFLHDHLQCWWIKINIIHIITALNIVGNRSLESVFKLYRTQYKWDRYCLTIPLTVSFCFDIPIRDVNINEIDDFLRHSGCTYLQSFQRKWFVPVSHKYKNIMNTHYFFLFILQKKQTFKLLYNIQLFIKTRNLCPL